MSRARPTRSLQHVAGQRDRTAGVLRRLHRQHAHGRSTTFEDDNLISSAQAHGVPLISGKQLVTWLDGRNASSFANVSWSANTLSFGISVGAGANGLTGMLPTSGPGGHPARPVRSGTAVTFTTSTVKGLEYASFAAASGTYTATYAPTGALAIAQPAHVVTTQVKAAGQAVVTWGTTEPATSEVAIGTTPAALTHKHKLGDASRQHRVALAGLKRGTTYYYRITSRTRPATRCSTPPRLRHRPRSPRRLGIPPSPRFPIRESSC